MKAGIHSYLFFIPWLKPIPGLWLLLISMAGFAQNDQCANASVINIPNNGYNIGSINSTINDISSATIEAGETFAPAIVIAGQNQKSIWYKFTLPTTRTVRVTLLQSGSTIGSADAGFTVYKTATCLPGVAAISTKLTPINQFGSTFHPCVEGGVYLVQVSAKSIANGSVYILVETGATSADYDNTAQAYDFGTLSQGIKTIRYSGDCQSTDEIAEACSSLDSSYLYNKSSWHVFKTPAYFDYVAFFLSYKNNSVSWKFGYKLYQGDVRTTPLSSLTLLDGCDSLQPGFFSARKFYPCEALDRNATYSIQLLFHQDFYDSVQATLVTTGIAQTQAPEPILSAMPASNNLGVLSSSTSGIMTTAIDRLACNSRHSLHPCMPSLPATGIFYQGTSYNLSTFYRFSLASVSNINLSAIQSYCGSRLLLRLFKQDLSNNCTTLDTDSIIGFALDSNMIASCLDPGNYVLQVLGSDAPGDYPGVYGGFINTSDPICGFTNLGQEFKLWLYTTTATAVSKYSLHAPGAIDTLNVVAGMMQPLVNGINYVSSDQFTCPKTVLPSADVCSTPTSVNTRALYREFASADSGVVSLINLCPPSGDLFSKLYKGDANTLAIAQNVFSYPLQITGLEPYSPCIQFNSSCEGAAKACITPGTYTYISFSDNRHIPNANQAEVQFDIVKTVHNSPANTEDMGDILAQVPAGGTLTSSIDHFSCRDNAIPINGFQPCTISGRIATKAIYRQFYLSATVDITIAGMAGCGYKEGPHTLFSGKATDGIAGLTALPDQWRCFGISSSAACTTLPAGWYTVVSYGIGPTYENQAQNDISNYQTYAGIKNSITLFISIPCQGPKYNRPYKAAIDSVTGLPFLIEWAPRVGHSAAYPKTDSTYTLYTESYNCVTDTPFISHPILTCDTLLTKVSYYVFRTTQECYLSIFTKGYWGAVYPGNVRTDSASFITVAPIHPCIQAEGKLQLCRLQPGTYTLVIFGSNENNCDTLAPKIYIDQVGYSRFDNAISAYDFGIIPPDSVYYSGKPGDINPLNPSRAASNDFIYCTTGSRTTDPVNNLCAIYNANIYNPQVNNYLYSGEIPNLLGIIPRRNLWYSFVAEQPGSIRVKVSSKTIGKEAFYKFAVYKSDVNGALSFSTLVSTGQVDSTNGQGLSLAAQNTINGCEVTSNEVSFPKPACATAPTRYYIVIDNPSAYPDREGGMHPNSQLEVSIMLDSVNFAFPGDFCSNPLVTTLNGAGSNTVTATIDCHTIGTDYGEYNPLLTCPPGGTTVDYKTSWFRIDITGTDTLDLTAYLTENTNANPSDIKYRIMDGNCGAMQERSCVQDAQTQDTYKCLPPGSYYVQVFVPLYNIQDSSVTGTIDLNVSAIVHAQACIPVSTCLSSADFDYQFDCNTSDVVTFLNYSTFGSAVQYSWDFGYNGQTSTAVTPQFSYPASATTQTYTVSLTVLNTTCGGQNTYTAPVTIPARPAINLGNDSTLCHPVSAWMLNATYLPGSVYQWQDGSGNATFTVNGPGLYWVKVSYDNCSSRDSIRVFAAAPAIIDSINVFVCPGQSYTLPWGAIVNNVGIYSDTVHYSSGCDSLVRIVNLDLLTVTSQQTDPVICETQSYTLPWGIVVNTAGTYIDTLQSVLGCDSLIRTVNLSIQNSRLDTLNLANCNGQGYTLSNGTIVNTPGSYPDTLHYVSGCDSIRRTIYLSISSPATINTSSASICENETFTLPWGIVVNSAGNYSDTINASTGCDSLINIVDLSVKESPDLSLGRSNDITCAVSYATLSVSGGNTYTWSPASTLNDPHSSNPVATPASTTVYYVIAIGANGCSITDSIEVKVIADDPKGGYLVPSAFTPDEDGINDCFGVPYWTNVTNFRFSIYNRWGELLFYSSNPKRCWDGRYKGKLQMPATYVYMISANGLCGRIFRKGSVVLFR